MVLTGLGESWRSKMSSSTLVAWLGEQREVRALGVGRRPERMRPPGPDREATRGSVLGRGDRGGHDVAPSAIGGSRSTRFSFASLVSSATIARPLRVSARPSGLPSSAGSSQTSSALATGSPTTSSPTRAIDCGLVAEQVEAPVRSDLEVAEVLAVGRQLDRGVPDRERDEDVIAILGRPAGAGLERGLGAEPRRLVALRPEFDEGGRVLLLGDQEVAVLHERGALALRALGIDPRIVERMAVGDLEGDPGRDRASLPVEQLDARRVLLEDQDPPGAVGADGLDLRVVARDQRALDVGQVDGLPDVGAGVIRGQVDPGRDRGPVAERDEGHVAAGLAPQADAGDLLQRHVLGPQDRQRRLVVASLGQ